MRKLAVFMMTTLDGSFEGEGGSIDWHMVDEEFNDWAIRQLDSLDTIVFGRVTYALMTSWWPTPEALEADPEVTKRMNAAEKVVCSRTLASTDWENTRIARDGVAELTAMKAGQGKDIVIFGSSRLCASLADAGLIDEYRLMVNPIVLGSGTPLFQGIEGQLDLNLQDVRTFGNGNVLLTYEPRRG